VSGRLLFASPVVLRYCGIELRKDWVEISVYGTKKFDLKLRGPAPRVVINGKGFLLDRRTRSVSFENGGEGWRLKMAQLGAG